MKRFPALLLLVVFVLAVAQPMSAQDSQDDKKKEKAEKKLWKKKAKSYAKEPLSLRDDLETANRQLKECSDRNKALQGKFAAQEATIDSLTNILNAKTAELAALNTKYEKLQAAYEAQKNVTDKGIVPGLVYRVQVGAYVHFDMNQHLVQTDKTFEGETQDGMNKYMMGNFRDAKFADAFKEDIRKLGIKDAWVVPYIDGKRSSKEEAEKFQAAGGKGTKGGVDTGDASGKGAVKGSNTSSGKDAVKGTGDKRPGKDAVKGGGK
jgi:hypothetical protein